MPQRRRREIVKPRTEVLGASDREKRAPEGRHVLPREKPGAALRMLN